MGISQLNIENVEIRLAENKDEVRSAQRLRYNVFYEEYKAKPDEKMARERRDMDDFDDISDHLVVLDKSITDHEERIVGTYRLLNHRAVGENGSYYTSSEYNIDPLLNSGQPLLELGRSCVLSDYRTRPVLQLLWQGIVDYMISNDIGILFGCASLGGTDVDQLSEQLAYMHHNHLAPETLRPVALQDRYVDMDLHGKDDINARKVFKELPPLIKGYLRVGATIGEGAVVDHQFNTTDVCIVFPVSEMSSRYKRHYSRKIKNSSLTQTGSSEDHERRAAGEARLVT